jgi:glyoxylase-like metal-dependent hydrolase (beta-lactamase superfamily II)
MKQISPRVYIEDDISFVTIGAVLTQNGWVCIDTPPYPREAQAWRSALQAVKSAPIYYLINTDAQRDRILTNAFFDAPIVVHAVASEAMLGLRNAFISQAAEDMSSNDNELVEIGSLRVAAPQVSFTHSMELECGDIALTLNHRPGATEGSIWVVVSDEKVIFAGDDVVVEQHPYISDGATKPWLTSLRMLRHERYADWAIVSGRGGLTRAEDTEQLSEYLRVARRRINSLMRSGRPRSDLSGLINEFLAFYPFPHNRRDEVSRRVKVGLEAIYEELRESQDEDIDTE